MVIEDGFQKPPVQPLSATWISERDITLSILRLDLIHPEISGNKWFKLKENIKEANRLQKSMLITFGGIWSNHLVATAATASILGLHNIGIVRGWDGRDENLTKTLKHCQRLGMDLIGISRKAYRERHSINYLNQLKVQFPNGFIIPEGGNNEAGKVGSGEIEKYIPKSVSHVSLAVGTGTTFAGIRKVLDQKIKMTGFAPFKKVADQKSIVQNYCPDIDEKSWEILPDKIWKGFGKRDSRLIAFMNDFYTEFKIPLDVVYTAKMMFYLQEMIVKNKFPKGSHILAIHSGGLQGNDSLIDLLNY